MPGNRPPVLPPQSKPTGNQPAASRLAATVFLKTLSASFYPQLTRIGAAVKGKICANLQICGHTG
jgi:hypothetical protein